MSRQRAIALLWILGILQIGASQAYAAQRHRPPIERTALALAAIIRQAAHQDRRAAGTLVRTSGRARRKQTLAVYYRARASAVGQSRFGGYELQLVTERGLVQKVTVSEFRSTTPYR